MTFVIYYHLFIQLVYSLVLMKVNEMYFIPTQEINQEVNVKMSETNTISVDIFVCVSHFLLVNNTIYIQ